MAKTLSTLDLKVADIRGYFDELPLRDAGKGGSGAENRGVEIFVR